MKCDGKRLFVLFTFNYSGWKKHRLFFEANLTSSPKMVSALLADQKARASSSYRKRHENHKRAPLPTTKRKVQSMEQKVCGIDIHRDTLVTTILDNTNHKQTQIFQNSILDMEQLKNHLRQNNCKCGNGINRFILDHTLHSFRR